MVCFYGFQCNSSAVCESLKGFFLWFTDCLTIGIIHETMVVHMTWVWTFFNNYSNHPRMCVLSTLCGNVDKHSPFDIYIDIFVSSRRMSLLEYFSKYTDTSIASCGDCTKCSNVLVLWSLQTIRSTNLTWEHNTLYIHSSFSFHHHSFYSICNAKSYEISIAPYSEILFLGV